MDDKEAENIAKELNLGATGRYPEKKALRPEDEGELKSAIIEEDGHIVIVFGKSIKWVSLTPEGAMELAVVLATKAKKLKDKNF